MTARAHCLRRLTAALLCVAAGPLIAAPTSDAADRIYWANDGSNTISWANLDGSGDAHDLQVGNAIPFGPMGMAIDSANGRVYWANWGLPNPDETGSGTTISWANLDGSGGGDLPITGTPVSGPHGMAVDPADGRIYWPNVNTDTISYANLDGSGGAVLPVGAATVDQPRGVAIDPIARRIYWANWAEGSGTTISWANLNGSGGGNILTSGVALEGPEGVALDVGAGRIYWGNFSNQNSISYANLDGSGGAANLNTLGATVDNAHGVAIDPIAGRIYWPNFYVNSISWANLNGSGGGNFPPSATAGASLANPDLPVILKAPSGTGAPAISGDSVIGSTLTCTQGSWAPDLIGSLLYRSPENDRFSYQWSRNGTNLAESSAIYTANVGGEYRCTVTARNEAGSAQQTSAAHLVIAAAPQKAASTAASNGFSFGGLTRDLHNGTATLTVEVPQAGTLTMNGNGVKRLRGAARAATGAAVRQVARGIVELPIKPKGKARKHLNRTGKAQVIVRVTYTPNGGAPLTHTRTVTLRKKL